MQKALKKLGITPNAKLSLDVILGESFNGKLYGLSDEQLEKVSALREIVAKYEKSSRNKRKKITNSSDAAEALYHLMKNLGHEEVLALFLNANNEIIQEERIFKGSTSEVNINSRDIIARALSANAVSIILSHNHPSGNPLPSAADVKHTESLKKACDALGLSLIDHIIICKGKYYSFSDEHITSIA